MEDFWTTLTKKLHEVMSEALECRDDELYQQSIWMEEAKEIVKSYRCEAMGCYFSDNEPKPPQEAKRDHPRTENHGNPKGVDCEQSEYEPNMFEVEDVEIQGNIDRGEYEFNMFETNWAPCQQEYGRELDKEQYAYNIELGQEQYELEKSVPKWVPPMTEWSVNSLWKPSVQCNFLLSFI